METTAVITLLRHGNQLKRTARTGWVQRGVPHPEDTAAHSYGVVFAAMVLAELVDEEVDNGRLLAIAALHDLPEGLTTDIPTPAWKYMPDGVKTAVERGAMQEITGGTPLADKFMPLWEELHADETIEARLVHDADKIDMFLQALIYQEQTGNRHLDEFWTKPFTFRTPQAQAIYDSLRADWLDNHIAT